jgi:hypothetical protein
MSMVDNDGSDQTDRNSTTDDKAKERQSTLS